jgi:alkylation response protein AidB-like acyl-CoA dehydrogenase
VPKENVLGEVGRGFDYMMRNLPQERMQIAVGSLGRVRAALRWTVDNVRERTAFGKPIGALQNTRFALADVATEVFVAEAFIDRCVIELNAGRLSPSDAAKANCGRPRWSFVVSIRASSCSAVTAICANIRSADPRSTPASPGYTAVPPRSCAKSSGVT